MDRNYREYRSVDKSAWPKRGLWDNEPDKAQWIDEATGLDCLIVRNRSGALCGYVGVPDTHPLHGKSYNDAPSFDCHGGLTFSDKCSDMTEDRWREWVTRMEGRRSEATRYPIGDAARDLRELGKFMTDFPGYVAYCETRHICHKPEAGRPDHVWWFGFDCAHSGDISPAYDREGYSGGYDSYRSWSYVRHVVAKLAADIAHWTATGKTLDETERHAD